MLVALAAISSCAAPAEKLRLSEGEWHEDLGYFARELRSRHANAFHHVSRATFDAAVADLDRQIDHLDPDAIYVNLDRIANLVGDGHTYVQFPRDQANLPIGIARFGDDYRVTSVGAGLEAALGKRVVKIQDTPIARAHELVWSLTPADENDELREANAAEFLTIGLVLHGLGITSDRNLARFTLLGDDGQTITVDVPAERSGAAARPVVRPFAQPPLARSRPNEKFWCVELADARAVYCNVRAIRDLGDRSAEMIRLIGRAHIQKLVIDLRQNSGGDYFEGLDHLVHPIRDLPEINRKGHLYVIVGATTFSAAMNNAVHFRQQTAAILVGQTIGEKPNSYAEPRSFLLPNSHLTVRYSTRYYQFVAGPDNVVHPDREIIPSWDDYRAGRDPVLEWILAQP